MLPVLNPKSYDGARVLEASGRPILPNLAIKQLHGKCQVDSLQLRREVKKEEKEWWTRHLRSRKKEKGDVGVDKEKWENWRASSAPLLSDDNVPSPFCFPSSSLSCSDASGQAYSHGPAKNIRGSDTHVASCCE